MNQIDLECGIPVYRIILLKYGFHAIQILQFSAPSHHFLVYFHPRHLERSLSCSREMRSHILL